MKILKSQLRKLVEEVIREASEKITVKNKNSGATYKIDSKHFDPSIHEKSDRIPDAHPDQKHLGASGPAPAKIVGDLKQTSPIRRRSIPWDGEKDDLGRPKIVGGHVASRVKPGNHIKFHPNSMSRKIVKGDLDTSGKLKVHNAVKDEWGDEHLILGDENGKKGSVSTGALHHHGDWSHIK